MLAKAIRFLLDYFVNFIKVTFSFLKLNMEKESNFERQPSNKIQDEQNERSFNASIASRRPQYDRESSRKNGNRSVNPRNFPRNRGYENRETNCDEGRKNQKWHSSTHNNQYQPKNNEPFYRRHPNRSKECEEDRVWRKPLVDRVSGTNKNFENERAPNESSPGDRGGNHQSYNRNKNYNHLNEKNPHGAGSSRNAANFKEDGSRIEQNCNRSFVKRNKRKSDGDNEYLSPENPTVTDQSECFDEDNLIKCVETEGNSTKQPHYQLEASKDGEIDEDRGNYIESKEAAEKTAKKAAKEAANEAAKEATNEAAYSRKNKNKKSTSERCHENFESAPSVNHIPITNENEFSPSTFDSNKRVESSSGHSLSSVDANVKKEFKSVGKKIHQSNIHINSSLSPFAPEFSPAGKLNQNRFKPSFDDRRKPKQQLVFKETKGDLLSAPEEFALALCLSADITLKKGVGSKFKDKYKGLRQKLVVQEKKVGEVAFLNIEGRSIYFLIIKEKPKVNSNKEDFIRAINSWKNLCVEHGIKKMAIPRLGCGFDKMKWSDVKSIIKNVFSDVDLHLLAYCQKEEINDEPPQSLGESQENTEGEVYGSIVFKEVMGDLFTAPKDYALAHCVAADLRMGSGIAVIFRKKFKKEQELWDQGKGVGEVAFLDLNGRYIYYLITKAESSGKPTKEDFIRAINSWKDLCVEHNVKKIAIPRLGCGLDRLKWDFVKPTILEAFEGIKLEIVVYRLEEKNP